MPLKPTARLKGFTLVEILVVIAVMSVFAAALFAVFARVREAGRRTVCASNLKQLALGMQQYIGDNSGTYPVMRGPSGATPSEANRIYAMTGPLGWSYSIAPYIGSDQNFHCPSQPRRSPEIHLSSQVDYTFNFSALNQLVPSIDGSFHYIVRQPDGRYGRFSMRGRGEADLAAPAKTWMNADTTDINAGGSPLQGAAGATAHSGSANHSFADGHTKWLTPQGIKAMERSAGNPPFFPFSP